MNLAMGATILSCAREDLEILFENFRCSGFVGKQGKQVYLCFLKIKEALSKYRAKVSNLLEDQLS